MHVRLWVVLTGAAGWVALRAWLMRMQWVPGFSDDYGSEARRVVVGLQMLTSLPDFTVHGVGREVGTR